MFLKKKSKNIIGFNSEKFLALAKIFERNLKRDAIFDKKFFRIEK